MKKIFKYSVFLLILQLSAFLTLSSASGTTEESDIEVQLRLYEGFRSRCSSEANIISSYYLKQLPRKKVPADILIEKEQNTLKKVFSLTDIKLLTQASMRLKRKRNKSPFQVIILNGRKLLVQLTVIHGQKNRFLVEVMEDMPPSRSLLEASIVLPQGKSTVLGFEDSNDQIYFLSFHRFKDIAPPLSPPGEPTNPQIENIKKPWLIRKVDPKYPDQALKSEVEGEVMIEATTNIDGDVVKAVAHHGHPLLIQAAIEAIRQWKYAPYIIKGEKKPVQFTVIMRFRLPDKKENKPISISSQEKPKLLKRVEPEYPEDALKASVQGKVVIEATTNKVGKVVEANVIDGHPLLNKAALKAISQWEYEPYLIDGEKKAVKFTVVMNFKLKPRVKKPVQK